MANSFDGAQRTALQRAAARGDALRCPACDIPLSEQIVHPNPALPYVRRRVWLLCPQCRRTAAVDLPQKRTQG